LSGMESIIITCRGKSKMKRNHMFRGSR
jgi:hypothetical protein